MKKLLNRIVFIAFLIPTFLTAQMSQAEHESHHPEEAAKSKDKGKKMGGMGEKMGGGMGEMMGGMMKKMGVPPKKDLYPELMDIPDMSLAQRTEISNAALLRMLNSSQEMLNSMGKLISASEKDNLKMMQNATEELKGALSQFESGLVTRRALIEGKAPRNIALKWFKKEMNLISSTPSHNTAGILGVSWFHFYMMAFLIIAFSVFLLLYFFKMRRAGQLLQELTNNERSFTEGKQAENNLVPTTQDDQPNKNQAPITASNTPLSKFLGQLKIISIFEETSNVKTFRLADPGGVSLPFTYLAGQFMTVKVNVNGKEIKRSYTIASTPSQHQYCELTIKREPQGTVSKYLSDEVSVGDLLEVTAPIGKFVFTGTESNSIALISGGVGITPMMSVARYLLDTGWGKPIYFIHICKTVKDLIFAEELKYMQKRHKNFNLIISMTRELADNWQGHTGRMSQELITEVVPDLNATRYHICGPDSMMNAAKDLLISMKIDSANIKVESFGAAPKKVEPSSPETQADTQEFSINFSKSAKIKNVNSSISVLEAAEEIGVEIDSSCRDGSCGACLVKLSSGKVTMACEDGLDSSDKDQGFILACQAKATSDLEVEA